AIGNVISGNIGAGIAITGTGSSNNQIQSNFIGSDFTGTLPLGNGTGISIAASGNVVGGIAGVGSNLVSGNLGDGLTITGDGNRVQGNNFGCDYSGFLPLPNHNGIVIVGSRNLIGGADPLEGSTISGNTNIGVYVAGAGNEFYDNAIGINDN